MTIVKTCSQKELTDNLNNYGRIVLYGAGVIGGLVKEWLDTTGRSDSLKCFVNTAVDKPYEFNGIMVYGLSDVSFSENDVVILCALPDKHEAMVSALESAGATQAAIMSGETIKDLERTCVNHRRYANNTAVSDKYDVLVFSQDNNATSGAFISMANLCEELKSITGYKILIVLPLCGDGEKLLKQKKLDHTYFYRESSWTKQNDGLEEESSFLNEDEIEDLCDFINCTGVKLVHNSGSFVYAGGVAAKRLGIPAIWHMREELSTIGVSFKNKREAYSILNGSAGVICVSEYVKRSLPELDEDKAHVIYNGVDDGVFYKQRRIFDRSPVRIVMIGHITAHKGQKTLVEALGILKNKMPEIPYVTFVGSAQYGYLEELKKYVNDMDLNEYVAFAGMTNTPEKYYHDSDMAVSATVGGEGFDRVRIEAMMSGCLLFANDAGAAREIVRDGETGYLYESGNAESLADVIIAAMSDVTGSRRIAENGQKICMDKFTKKRNARQVADLYQTILGKI